MLGKLLRPRKYDIVNVFYSGKRLKAYVADSFLKRMYGLMYWDNLEKDKGMLFVLGKPTKAGIWMLNMRFPIDIIWLDETGKVVWLVKDVKPCKNFLGCKVYKPGKPAMYVLEVKSGTADRLGIKRSSKLSVHLSQF